MFRHLIPWLLAITLLQALSGCNSITGERVEGSGVPSKVLRTVSGFSSVHLRGSMDATILVGRNYQVVLIGDDNILPLITTEVRADGLIIDTHSNIRPHLPLRVEIHLPDIDACSISGSGDIEVSGISGQNFSASIAGSGDIHAAGRSEILEVSIAGSGSCDLRELDTETADISISGSGDVLVLCRKTLSASIAGSGDVKYLGNPRIESHVSGSGSVQSIER